MPADPRIASAASLDYSARRDKALCHLQVNVLPWLGVFAASLAGLGCSALLPLTISFGQKELTTIAASVAGGLIAFYQIGYGVAAFGVGPLHEGAGLSLAAVFGATAVVALAMAALARVVVGRLEGDPS